MGSTDRVVAARYGAWHRGRLAAFDVGTTGLDVDTGRVVTVAVWRIDTTTGAKTCSERVADPGVEIPEAAAELGYLVERGVPVVVFNAAYDLTLLDRELARYGQSGDPSGMRVIDPMVLDRQVDWFRTGRRTLAGVCGYYGIILDGESARVPGGCVGRGPAGAAFGRGP